MVCDAIVVLGKRGTVLVTEKWVAGVWVVVAAEMVAQLSRQRECHRTVWWELEYSW